MRRPNDESLPGLGSVRYDLLFEAMLPAGGVGDLGILVNVETQLRGGLSSLVARGAYYCARLLANQKGRYFEDDDYGMLRKVYSIWILVHPPKGVSNVTLFSEHIWQSDRVDMLPGVDGLAPFDYANMVIVGLGTPGACGYTTIAEMLAALLSRTLSASEKERILGEEYGIKMDGSLRDGVRTLGSLGELYCEEARLEGLACGLEQGLERGREQGRAQGLTAGRLEAFLSSVKALMEGMGMSASQAMDAMRIPDAERKELVALL